MQLMHIIHLNLPKLMRSQSLLLAFKKYLMSHVKATLFSSPNLQNKKLVNYPVTTVMRSRLKRSDRFCKGAKIFMNKSILASLHSIFKSPTEIALPRITSLHFSRSRIVMMTSLRLLISLRNAEN